jgi:hypothetical protein
MGKTIILGDIHYPWHHKAALTHVLEVIKRDANQITHVIQVGDLYDFYSLSRFPRSHDLATPVDEITEAREMAIEMWAYIRKVAPKAKCVQLLGNHDARLKLRIVEKLPEILGIVSFDHLWQFPGVKTYHDEREEVIINGVCYFHGFYTQISRHARENQMPTVHGHTHRGGVWFGAVQNRPLWELDVGYLGNPASKVMSFTKQKWSNWTLGYGEIDERGPRFIPIRQNIRSVSGGKVISMGRKKK